MHKIIAIFLAVLLLLSLAACGGPGTDPEAQTAASTAAGDPGGTAAPGQTEDPYPTQAPERSVFNPETDHDDRVLGFLGAVVDTEDAYYLASDESPFLLYYDKASGDSGILCPRPECLHDREPTRAGLAACGGYIGYNPSSLTYYEGRLWWLDYYQPERETCLFSMAPDGSDRQMAAKLGITGSGYQPQQYWLHRGWIYFYSEADTVEDGSPSHRLAIVRLPMEGGEIQEIYAQKSYMGGEWTLRLIGDDVYILAGSDGADGSAFPGGKPQTPEDLKALQEKTLILRWNPAMREPELLLEEDSLNQPSPDNFYVERDGTVWFVRHRPEDPSVNPWEEDYRETDSLCRLDRDGAVTELFDSVIDGARWYMRNIFESGVILLQDLRAKPGSVLICITDFEGNVKVRGELPTAFLERLPAGASESSLKYLSARILQCRSDGFVACFSFYFPDDETHPYRQYFVNYEITPEGLAETFLAESMTVIYHE